MYWWNSEDIFHLIYAHYAYFTVGATKIQKQVSDLPKLIQWVSGRVLSPYLLPATGCVCDLSSQHQQFFQAILHTDSYIYCNYSVEIGC